MYCTQDEIHKRPRILTQLESLSRYEAVASPEQDEEEGEAKTAKSSQVRVYFINLKASTLSLEQSNVELCIFNLAMQILSNGFENILNY